MEILTEFDGFQEALKKVNLDESVMPYVNGRLVDDKAWNKTQKILNCPEMISAHKYLYNLDMDQLTEEEIDKIDQLYQLGCDRGFIIDDLTDWNKTEEPAPEASKAEDKPEDRPIEFGQKSTAGSLFKAKVPCWTVIYSATSKDGDIKTGEAYSNAISISAAKADVNAKLSRIGYSNISILAIEATDACDCAASHAYENDMLDGRPHNNHISEADDEEKEESSEEDTGKDVEKEETSTDEESDSKDADEEDADEESDDESIDDANDESDEKEEDSEEEEEASEESEESEEEDSKDTSDDDTSDEESEDDEKEELDANQKAELKDKYRKTFKNVLTKCKFESSFNDLTLEQKVKFFTELSKAWTKNEPNEFMTDKEIEQLNNVVVKEESDD